MALKSVTLCVCAVYAHRTRRRFQAKLHFTLPFALIDFVDDSTWYIYIVNDQANTLTMRVE